ncbi:MAG TPA: AraC family transcriptional regulator [Chitinophagaceae bacterium]
MAKKLLITEEVRKKEGFQGQKAIVIPRKILNRNCAGNEVINTLYVTDIGYYPKAKFHYRERQHGAEQHILIYCYDGSGSVTIDKKEYTIEAGEFIFIPIKTAHRYEADKTDPWTIYWAHFKGSISDNLIEQLQRIFPGNKGFLKHNERTIELFNEIYEQLERGYSVDNLMYSNMCLWHFFTTFLFNSKHDVSGDLAFKDPINQVIDYLKSKLENTITLDEIAGVVNLSPSHFSYLFKTKTGFSPIEYFNNMKIQKACQYLLFTKLRIKEIADNLGMEDPYYFSRLFKKVMGMSPEEYREKRIH